MLTPAEIVSHMLKLDAYSQWLGVTVVALEPGSCTLSCPVKPEMLNGFQILHGGISYSLADSALAFASNAYGYQCVSIETSISHTRPVQAGDTLTAVCTELHRGKTIGIYETRILNAAGKLVALFKGTVHISQEVWEL
jgi:acyl-CoA thioesterase